MLALMKSCAAISALVSPPAARRAIWCSCGVRSVAVSTVALAGALAGGRELDAGPVGEAVAPMSGNVSWAGRSWSRASVRRFWRRSHSP